MRAGITLEKVGGLLYYGRRVQVVEPAWLRERVAKEHRRAAQIYERANRDVNDPLCSSQGGLHE